MKLAPHAQEQAVRIILNIVAICGCCSLKCFISSFSYCCILIRSWEARDNEDLAMKSALLFSF